MKTIKSITKEICKREGLKKQIDIAQVSEIMGHLCDIIIDHEENYLVWDVLVSNGLRRAKKKKK